MANSEHIRRHLVGLVGAVLLVAGLVGMARGRSDAAVVFGQAAMLKVGIVLILLWLALPQLRSFPRWLAAVAVGVVVMLAVRPQVALTLVRASLFLLPLLPFFWLLRPRERITRRDAARRDRAHSPPR